MVRRPRLSRRFISALASVLILACAAHKSQSSGQALPSPLPRDEVQAAWQRAKTSGTYHFTADIVQTTIPLPTVANIGQRSQRDRLYLEGQASLPEQYLDMRLWSQEGSLLDLNSGFEVRVEGERAYSRQADQDWQEIDNFMGLFANQGDLMAFLTAARDIERTGQETWAGQAFTRYTFQVSGYEYATHVRDQLQATLAEKGELPPGLSLDLPEVYAEMTGQGELWVDADGLPARQILHLAFPPTAGSDHRIENDVVVDFSAYRQLAELPPTIPVIGLAVPGLDDLRPTPRAMQQSLLSLATLAFAVVLVTHRRSRRFYAVVAVTLIMSSVFSPAVSSVQAARFTERQAARAQEQRERQAQSQAMQEAQQAQAQSSWNPHADPLASQVQVANGTQASGSLQDTRGSALYAGPQALAADSSPQRSPDDKTDTDRDGLTDYVEERIGTLPDFYDSDGDGITDTLEVRGFEWAGKHWYADPLEADTNKDGLDDTREWHVGARGDGTPPDSDNDGVPDLFDRDNDGDGVPDRQDLSPYQQKGSFGEQNAFSFHISNLNPGKVTYVEFQLRPTAPQRLWYAYNVLDWPEDKRGQIQDADKKSLYDVAQDKASTLLNPNTNGDLRVLPMLEITIDTAGGAYPSQLPSRQDLQAYGISVQNLDQNGYRKALYVPLSLISDEQETRVAFQGKMIYEPAGAWGNNHSVRLVWALQMLVDRCKSYTGKDQQGQAKEYPECQQYDSYNQLQIVHVYYDDWTLTGLNIREDHGMDVALVYEDPAQDPHPNDDSVLIGLSTGLQDSFLVGRDQDSNGRRDIAITPAQGDSTIAERFDYTLNSSLPLSPTRFNLQPNILRVRDYTYPHQDLGLAHVTMTETKSVLAAFTTYWTAAAPITPSLLIAREERFRPMNLDAIGEGAGYARWSTDYSLAVDMHPSNKPAVLLQTVASLNMAPYCYNEANGWKACDINIHWNELHRRYIDSAGEPGDSADVARGKLVMAQLYYVALYNGLSQPVAIGDKIAYQPQAKPDSAIAGLIGAAWKVHNISAVWIINQFVVGYESQKPLWTFLGQWASGSAKTLGDFQKGNFGVFGTVSDLFASPFRYLIKHLGAKYGILVGLAGVAIIAAAIVVVISLLVYAYLKGQRWVAYLAAGGVAALLVAIQVIVPIVSVIKVIRATYQGGVSLAQAVTGTLSASASIIGTSLTASVLTLVLSVALAWGMFVVQLVIALYMGQLTTGVLVYLGVQAVVATALAVVSFILSLTVIGALLVAIWGVVEIAFLVLCKLGEAWACGLSLSEIFTQEITHEVYSDLPLIYLDTPPAKDFIEHGFVAKNWKPLIEVGQPQLGLSNPQRGWVADAGLDLTLPVTTNLHTNLSAYQGPRDVLEDRTKQVSIKYQLNSSPSNTLSASRNDMPWAWQGITTHGLSSLSSSYTTAWKRENVKGSLVLQAGVNWPLPFYFHVAMAVPQVVCRFNFPTPDHITFKKCAVDATWTHQSTSSLGDNVVLDVLPATFGEFYSLAGTNDAGYRLAWDDKFPTLVDADGDGLRSGARGLEGADPDDGAWDSDRDGLSDAFELAQRSQGIDLSPIKPDTDGDGLSDAEEVRLGTDPSLQDSDNDGLGDKEELDGWLITLAASTPAETTVHVRSNPNSADADQDGLSDQAEKLWAKQGYHPQVWNTSPFGVYVFSDDADGFLVPGQRVTFSTQVRNSLSDRPWYRGSYQVEFPPALGGGYRTGEIGLASGGQNGYTTTLETALTVPGTAPSGAAAVASTVRVQLGANQAGWRVGHSVNAYPRQASGAIQSTAATPLSHLGFGEAYLVSTLQKSSELTGDVVAYALTGKGGAQAVDIPDDTYDLKGNSPSQAACADNGNCLVVWQDVYYANCTQVTFDRLDVHSQADEWSSWSEYRLDWNGQQVWDTGWDQAYAGKSFPINKTLSFCGNGTIRLWEYNLWPAGFDDLGSQAISAAQPTPPGQSSSRRFTIPGIDDVTLYWHVHASPAYQIAGALVRANTERDLSTHVGTIKNQFVIGAHQYIDANPSVATDGTDFQVVWNTRAPQLPGIATIASAHVSNGGNVSSPILIDYSGGWDSAEPDIVWAGDRYFAAWQHNALPRQIWGAQIARDGRLTHLDRVSPADNGSYESPQLAYEAPEWQVLMAYREGNSGSIHAQTVHFNYDGSLFPGLDQTVASRGTNPQVGYDPFTQSWLIGWSDGDTSQGYQFYYRPWAWGLKDVSVQPVIWNYQVTDPYGVSLACPPTGQAPVLSLNFESSKPAYDTSSTSGYVHVGECSEQEGTCPTPLASGAPKVKPGLYAYAFDGMDDRLTFLDNWANSSRLSGDTLSAWFKADPDVSDYRVILSDEADAGNGLRLSYRLLLVQGSGELRFDFTSNQGTWHSFSTGARVNDNAWHHVAAVRNHQAKTVKVYLDGVTRVESSYSGTIDNDANPLWIGMSPHTGGVYPFKGLIDQVYFYPSALSEDAIRQLAAGNEDNWSHACIASAPSADYVNYAQISVREAVESVVHVQQDSTRVVVDAEAPAAAITSLQDGQYVRVAPTSGDPAVVGQRITDTLIMGGTAQDQTSLVERVELSVDGGAWQPASGTEHWSFPLEVTHEGQYRLRVRATDTVGHVQGTPHQVIIIVDNSPPQVAASLPLQPQAITRSGPEERWAIALQGTATDPGIGSLAGSGVSQIELQLQGQSQGMSDGDWQAATLNGVSWVANYALPAHVADPSGAYTVTVRAMDAAGNASGETRLGVLAVDVRAPIADVVAPGSSLEQDAFPGPVLYLPLNEQAGASSFADVTGYHQAATCSSPACPAAGAAGQLGRSLRFDGLDDVVSVEDAPQLRPAAFSISAWFRWNRMDTDEVNFITAKGSENWEIHTGGGSGTNGLRIIPAGWPESSVDVPGAIRPGWNHVVATYDGHTTVVYVNGALRGRRTGITGANDLAADNSPFRVGRRGNGSYPFNGQIDEVRLYDQVLSAAQVQALYTAAPLAGTVLHLPLDEPAGASSFANLAETNNAGTCAGGACPTAGVEGQYGPAVQLDGVDDSIRVAHSAAFSVKAFTLSAWFKWNRTGTNDINFITAKGEGNWEIHTGGVSGINGLRVIPAGWSASGVDVPNAIQPGWNHVAVAYDGRTTVVYVNGVPKGERTGITGAHDLAADNSPFRVGCRGNDGYPFDGQIDDVRLYNHVLSPADILRLMQPSLPGDSRLHLPLDEQAGAVSFVDAAGYGNTATCSGTACPTAGISATLGTACRFEGSDYLEVPDSPALRTPQFSLSAWFLWDDYDTGQVQFLFSKGFEALEIHTGGGAGKNGLRVIPAGYPETSLDVPNFIQPGWNHVAVSFTGRELYVYRNGLLVGSRTGISGGTDLAANTQPLSIGRRGDGSFALRGELDDVRLYNRPLSALEVQALSQVALPGRVMQVRSLGGLVSEPGTVAAGVTGLETALVPAQRVDLQKQALVHLPLDEAAGAQRFVDASQHGYDGICQGTSCPTSGETGHAGTAVHFDGADDTITLPDPNLGQAFAVSAWINANMPGPFQRQHILGYGGLEHPWSGAFRLEAGYTGELYLAIGDGSSTAEQAFYTDWANNYWHHLVVSYDGTTAYVYQDGRQVSSMYAAKDISGGKGTFILGSLPNQRPPLSGLLDEVYVFDRALAADEVQALYYWASPDWQPAVLSAPGSNAAALSWSIPVPATEGIYQLDLRTADAAGNRQVLANQWYGEIDSLAPRLGASSTSGPTFYSFTPYRYTFTVEDYWLDLASFQHPCPPNAGVAITYDTSTWWQSRYPDLSRPTQAQVTCEPAYQLPLDSIVSACDRYGHCAQSTIDSLINPRLSREPGQAELLSTAIFTPARYSVLATAAPVTATGGAYAQDYLQSLAVSLDGTPFYTEAWSQAQAITVTLWTQSWTPVDGVHVFDSVLSDWAGRTTSDTITVTVDTQPPALALTSHVITTSHEMATGVYRIGGVLTDTGRIASVQARVGQGAWLDGKLDGNSWHVGWTPGDLADGEAYTITAQAVDVAGRVARITDTLVADVVPPALVTVSLAYVDRYGLTHAIAPGQTISDGSELHLAWTAGQDGSGIAGYAAGWTENASLAVGDLSHYAAAGEHVYHAGEAQVLYAHLVAWDSHGNQKAQTLGPVYVDAPQTPDVTALNYDGWMDSSCTWIGADRQVAENAQAGSSLAETQELYATWDSDGLRLGWSGADWNVDGDLFIYLDTSSWGGVQQLYNPYSATLTNTVIYLPGTTLNQLHAQRAAAQPSLMAKRRARLLGGRAAGQRAAAQPQDILPMAADYAIWVQDGQAATLLVAEWSLEGYQWVVDTQLGSENYSLDTSLKPVRTDLYVPFYLLGITDPGQTEEIWMVAVASEENALRLWAAMPGGNPLNSQRVANPVAATSAQTQTFALTQKYKWSSFGAGLCPSQDQLVDADLQLSLTADPAGVIYSFEDLFWLWEMLFGASETDTPSESFDFMDTDYALLGDGQVITYSLDYANLGRGTAYSLTADIAAWDALRLADADYRSDDPDGINCDGLTVELGDVAPGEVGQLTFTGRVDVEDTFDEVVACMDYYDDQDLCLSLLDWASLDVLVYDALTQPEQDTLPLDWIWSDHAVDWLAPEVIIAAPESTIQPGINTLSGFVFDESAVPTITLVVQTASDTTTLPACLDPSPQDGEWLCTWDTGGAQDGDTFTVTAYATDVLGHTSDEYEADWRVFVLDATPPAVTVDATVAQALGTSLLREAFLLSGQAFDERGISGVQVCRGSGLEQKCEAAAVQAIVDESVAHVYEDVPSAPVAIDDSTTCDGNEIVRSFSVVDDFEVGDVKLGLNVDHSYRGDLLVELESPEGSLVSVVYDASGEFGEASNLDVLLNDSAVGPLHNAQDDDTTAPYYDRQARPYEPLSYFDGESAAGTWTLYICDTYPDEDGGAYNRSRLLLTPQSAVSTEAWQWTYTLDRLDEEGDKQDYELSIYSTDLAGNHSSQPVVLSYGVDTVAPAVTVTKRLAQVVQTGSSVPVLAGALSDGSGVREVYVQAYAPSGELFWSVAEMEGAGWEYALHPVQSGQYTLWLEAVDEAGNAARLGPFNVDVALTPGYAQSADPASVLVYTHTLTNNSDAPGTFALQATSSQGWPLGLAGIAQPGGTLGLPVYLGAGMSATVRFSLTVPGSAISSTLDHTVITVTTQPGDTAMAVITDTTIVNHVAGFAFGPDRLGLAVPGHIITYTHFLTNTGNGPDSVALAHHSSQGWLVEYTTPVEVDYGQAASLVVSVTVPMTTADVSLQDVTVLTATSGSLVRTVTDSTLARHVPGVAWGPDRSGQAAPGSVITYTHVLTNTGTRPDIFDLAHHSSQGWSVEYVSPVSIGYWQATTVVVSISVPTDAAGLTDITVITATSRSSPTVYATLADTTWAVEDTKRIFLPVVMRNK